MYGLNSYQPPYSKVFVLKDGVDQLRDKTIEKKENTQNEI